MKNICLIAFAIFSSFALRAQLVAPDKLTTSKGDLVIQPVVHASVVLTFSGKNIYVDPAGGGHLFKGLAAPDLILITDIHGDHFDEKTIDSIKTPNTLLIVPQAVADKITNTDKSKVVVLKNGDHTEQVGVSISAIPMYNLPETADSKHPKGRGNGYIFEAGGKRLYFSGDTEDIPEMRALKNIDVAFVCMNLPYTMDINQAADAVLAFKPVIVYPYHYRGQNGLSDTNAFKQLVNAKDAAIDVRLRNWYALQ